MQTRSELSPRSAKIADPAICITNVSKRFKIYHRPIGRVADLIWPKSGRFAEVWALRNISFSVGRGECFGIVGSNGSGKSTLLKLITQTLLQTEGEIAVRGRVLALLELGGGINPELSGRDNVVASAILLGFPSEYASSRMEQIEAFADIGEFFDRPMRTYSSGMYVRLAFSIYLFMDPEILIVDEALSVGDVFFQQKCYEALREIMRRGTTVLFVSHDTGAVQKLCDRALVLDQGQIGFIGLPDEAVNRYHTLIGNRHARRSQAVVDGRSTTKETQETGSKAQAIVEGSVLEAAPLISLCERLSIVGARLVDEEGQAAVTFQSGDKVCLQLVLTAQADTEQPDVVVSLFDRFNEVVFSTSAARCGMPLAALKLGEQIVVEITLVCALQMGTYTIKLGLLGDRDDTAAMVRAGLRTPMTVHWDRPPSPFYGQIGLPCRLLDASPRVAAS